MKRIILDLCGGTGSWSYPYWLNGYEVIKVTLPYMDVRTYQPPKNVHGILAAPPCTLFANSAARWLRSSEQWHEAVEVTYACLSIIEQCNPAWWALENPVGRMNLLLGKPKMIFQPYDYGDNYSKKTALWGKFKPPFKGMMVNHTPKIWLMGPSPERQALRSVTSPGFAKAFFDSNP